MIVNDPVLENHLREFYAMGGNASAIEKALANNTGKPERRTDILCEYISHRSSPPGFKDARVRAWDVRDTVDALTIATTLMANPTLNHQLTKFNTFSRRSVRVSFGFGRGVPEEPFSGGIQIYPRILFNLWTDMRDGLLKAEVVEHGGYVEDPEREYELARDPEGLMTVLSERLKEFAARHWPS
jgi:hypothetical protein